MACGCAAPRDARTEVCGTITIVLLILFISLMGFGVNHMENKKLKAIHSSCNPREYLQELQVPRLLNHTLNSSIIVGLEFKRGAARHGYVAMYTDLSLRLYYGAGEDPVANRTDVPRFRMGDRRSVRYSVVVDAPRLPWEDAFDKISGGSTVLLRLVLSGKFKARDRREPDFYYGDDCNTVCVCEWSEFEAEAQVLVDASAHMISNTTILFND